MRSALAALLLLGAAGCATDPDAAGTSNPAVTTPAELPPSAAQDPVVADSTAVMPGDGADGTE